MQRITPYTNRRMHALLGQLGLMEQKADFVREFSDQRTDSSKELLEMEAQRLCNHLQQRAPLTARNMGSQAQEDAEACDTMRKKIIYYAHLMGWETPAPSVSPQGGVYAPSSSPNGGVSPRKADMVRINNWCVKHGMFKKPLNAHNRMELAALVSQMEIVYRKHLADVRAARV